jgi:hypothetical protein
MNVSSSTTATVTRSGGSTGAINVSYSASGGCSVGGTGTLSFADQSTAAQTFTVTSPASATTCLVSITPSGGTTGTPSVNIAVSAPQTQPVSTACPAGFVAPTNLLTASFLDLGVWWAQNQKSGQIVTVPLPKVITYSKQAAFGENIGAAYTPQPVVLEITISQCPGFIETDASGSTATHPNGNYCNLRSPNGTYNSITWFGKQFSVLNSTATANQYGYCWAPEGDANGPYYLNARWTYSSCPFGQSVCGFAIQQNLGPY